MNLQLITKINFNNKEIFVHLSLKRIKNGKVRKALGKDIIIILWKKSLEILLKNSILNMK